MTNIKTQAETPSRLDDPMRQKLTLALAGLKEDVRVPLVMHFMQGLSQEEVGKLTGVSQSMASRRIASGLEKLRLRLVGSGVAVWSDVAAPSPLQHDLAPHHRAATAGSDWPSLSS